MVAWGGANMVTIDNSRNVVGIVEDDRAVRDALCNLLSSVGIEVAAFGSAEELMESNQSRILDCLILDVILPEMSGPQLQHRLTEDRNVVPVIFITANQDQRLRKRALELGAAGFFYKPIYGEALLETLRATLS
jgi:FixJ family two-component response regulator